MSLIKEEIVQLREHIGGRLEDIILGAAAPF